MENTRKCQEGLVRAKRWSLTFPTGDDEIHDRIDGLLGQDVLGVVLLLLVHYVAAFLLTGNVGHTILQRGKKYLGVIGKVETYDETHLLGHAHPSALNSGVIEETRL